MTNPFDLAYLLAPAPVFGSLAWIFFILQVGGLVAGIYLMYMRQERDLLRRTLLRQLGLALLIMGGIGVLLGALRLGNVAVFNQRFWFYILLLVEVGLGGYVAYYLRSVYPRLVAQSQASKSKGSVRRPIARALPAQPEQNGTTSEPAAPRPVATTSRREARRDRKRRGR